MIEARSISMQWGGRSLLQAVSFKLEPGTVTALVGPNGSGKSTLLRILAGEIPARSGSVLLMNRDLHRWFPWKAARIRALLPQHPTLQFEFTAREVVEMGRFPHPPDGRRDAIVAEALDLVGLSKFATRNYLTLSGGERQRVQWARVLAQVWDVSPDRPAVLLLDEPTASLDWRHQGMAVGLARRWAARGATILWVMHDLNLALAAADRAILLHEGQVHHDTIGRVLTAETIHSVFGVSLQLTHRTPVPNGQWVLQTY